MVPMTIACGGCQRRYVTIRVENRARGAILTATPAVDRLMIRMP
jgi:hypothetical protein